MRGVVQIRQWLLREGVARSLDAEPDLEVVAAVATAAELAGAVEHHQPVDFAIVDLDGLTVGDVPTIRGVRLVASAARPADAAHVAGRFGIAEVVAHADGVTGLVAAIRRSPAPVAAPLTNREVDVLRGVAAGQSAHEIAELLRVSPKTVDNHKHRIYAKLGVQSQAHAVAVATRAGLISSGS